MNGIRSTAIRNAGWPPRLGSGSGKIPAHRLDRPVAVTSIDVSQARIGWAPRLSQRSQEADRGDEGGDSQENRTSVENRRAAREIGSEFAGRGAYQAETGEERRGDDLDSIIE